MTSVPVPESWSREAVIYQVYPRSFADTDGDGVGDLPGVLSRLDYLAGLGVDAIWLSPFYRSPMADGGYDVADHRAVDPVFGSLADFDALLAGAHRRGLRLIIDIVPNHTSRAHRWFQEALAAGPGSPARQRYVFRDHPGGRPPNDWHSSFGGPAWTPVDSQSYLHLFAPEQPDLNWDHRQVRAEFAGILRFWLDRGVDGLRVDVADALVKPPGLPDVGDHPARDRGATRYWDQDGVHDIYRQWRAVLDSYQPERIAVAEAWAPGPERLARYVRPDELHQAFNFRFLATGWSAAAYREVIGTTLAAMAAVGAPNTWVLSNHDVVRHASRLGRPDPRTGGEPGGVRRGEPPGDPVRGLARARAATLLMLALPGSAYLYQGEELGLPEVYHLPEAARQDPELRRSGGARLGRDGCRVPLPWSGQAAPFGFGPAGSTPWLPQPAGWAALTVAAQQADPDSTLTMYRAALRLRRRLRLGRGPVSWPDPAGPDVLAVGRPGLVCTTNCGTGPVRLPGPYRRPVLASGRLPGPGVLPPDTTVWWRATG
jgi:alpha-glucosidase